MPLAQGISQADCEAMSSSQFGPKRLASALNQLISAHYIGRMAMLGILGAMPMAMIGTNAVASELDVYEDGGAAASANAPVVTMMFDTSNSMGAASVTNASENLLPSDELDYPTAGCTLNNHKVVQNSTVTINNETIAYALTGCTATRNANGVSSGDIIYDRLSRLKLALIPLLANVNDSTKPKIKSTIKLGLGQYSTIIPNINQPDNKTGKMIVPAKLLTEAHRADLIKAISNLKVDGGTPTASALAEAGAYMLGTHTYGTLSRKSIGFEAGGRGNRVINPSKPSDSRYYKCPSILDYVPIDSNDTKNKPFLDLGLTHLARCSVNGYIYTGFGINDGPRIYEVNGESNIPYSPGYGNVSSPDSNKIKLYFYNMAGLYPDTAYSGFGYSDISTKMRPELTDYETPLSNNVNECGGGDGIFLMTDGNPTAIGVQSTSGVDNYVTATNNVIKGLMDKSLTGKTDNRVNCSATGLVNKYALSFGGRTYYEYPAIGCMGSYAKILREDKKIKTAVVGLGAVFSGIPKITFTTSEGEVVEKYNCDGIAIPSDEHKYTNKQSMCRLAEKGEGYGEGGFYFAQSSQDIADSLKNFIDSLSNQKYEPQPGDGPSVSVDVTNSTQTRAFAYLPLLQPYPGKSNLVWPGNLKKYKIKNGSLTDKNNKHIFSNIGGQIRATSKELWNDTATADGGQVQVAGAYAQLLAPNSTNLSSTRKVFVENNAGSGMTEIKVSGTNPSPAKFSTLGYNRQRNHYLLNFLGYDVPVFNPKGVAIADSDYASGGLLASAVDPLTNITNYVPANPIRLLGGINNSKPQEILYSYQQSLAADGSVSSTENYYTLFGSMDGALHLIDSSDGKEKFAFIPNAVVKDNHNVAALKEGSTQLADGTTNAAGNVAFGVDAPWHVTTKYYRDDATNSITTTLPSSAPTGAEAYVRAYGGLGRGGMGFYGLDITNATSPSWLFKINNTSNGFARLGQTWSAPVEAKVKYKTGSGSSATYSTKDVLFISGGYDLCYDYPKFTTGSTDASLSTACLNKAQAAGNAVYMIDAANGSLLWSASSSSNSPGKSTTNTDIKHSIVGEVSVIDTDLDGLVDAIYFADLGGQVFRADFDDSKAVNDDDVASKPAWAKRVVRILDTSASNGGVPYRFYQRPVVSAYRIDASNNVVKRSGAIKYVVSVASGDRNSPINKLSERAANSNPNKLISIWDTDIAKSERLTLADSNLDTKDISLSNLIQLGSAAPPVNYKTALMANKKDAAGNTNPNWKGGWYYNLTYFNGSSSQTNVIKSSTGVFSDIVGNSVSYLKAMGQPVIRSGRLYVSTYNRLAYISAGSTCTPAPTGVSEAQEYCLPFGVCDYSAPSVDNGFGRGRTYVLGSGLSTATFASVKDGSSETQLVTTEMSESNNGDPDSTTDDDPSTLVKVKDIFYSLYKLIPNQWFERTPAPTSNSSTGAP